MGDERLTGSVADGLPGAGPERPRAEPTEFGAAHWAMAISTETVVCLLLQLMTRGLAWALVDHLGWQLGEPGISVMAAAVLLLCVPVVLGIRRFTPRWPLARLGRWGSWAALGVVAVGGGPGSLWVRAWSINHALPRVPSLAGMSGSQAAYVLQGRGLAASPQAQEWSSPSVGRGQVIPETIDPPVGLRVARHSAVRFVLSRGPFPNVVGMPRQQAESVLVAAGLEPRVTWVAAAPYDDVVVAQEPRSAAVPPPQDKTVLITVRGNRRQVSIRRPSPQSPAHLRVEGGRFLFTVTGDSSGVGYGYALLLYVDPQTGDRGFRLQLAPVTVRMDGWWEGSGQVGSAHFPPQPGAPAITVAAVIVPQNVADRQRAAAYRDPDLPVPLPAERLAEDVVTGVPIVLP